MTNYEPQYMKALLISLAIALLLVTVLVSTSGCKLLSKVEKEKSEIKSDSSSVKKETDKGSKVDTSKTKSETTKETVYYPQPIIVPGKDGEIKVVFVPQTIRESGKQETQNFNYEDWFRQKTDSMRIAQLELELSKKTEIKGELLPVGVLIGMGFLGLVLIGLMVMVLRMKSQFTSINNLLTKKINV